MHLGEGQRVGSYEVIRELASGGMASVYLVCHVHTGAQHALKVLHPRFRGEDEVRRRFLDEAQTQASRLKHPNIVRVTDTVVTGDLVGLVMDYIDGKDLEDFIDGLSTICTRRMSCSRVKEHGGSPT